MRKFKKVLVKNKYLMYNKEVKTKEKEILKMAKARTVGAVHTHTHTHTSNSIKENKGRNTFNNDMQITDYKK